MSMLQIALDHARKGYYVHPLVPGDKMPLAGGNGYHDATRDEELIRAMWKAEPDANVGINLARSGIVDIAPDSVEWAAKFKANGMERTLLYVSGGGGGGHWHSWYRLPKGGPVARACVPHQYDLMSEGNAVAPGSIHPSGNAYVLHTPLLPLEDLPFAPRWAIEMLQEHVRVGRKEHNPEAWDILPSGAVLAHSRRFQALIKANDQLRMVCAGEAVTLRLKSGGTDCSPSIQRSIFVNQLLRAKYPHDEIRALALHFSGVLESKPKWFKRDIDRILDIYTPKDYSPESTGVIVQALRGGRPYEITDDEFLDRCLMLADCGVNGIILDWTRGELAAHFKVSYGTIQRIETRLAADDKLCRIVSDDHQRSSLVLSPETTDRTLMRCDQTYQEASIGRNDPCTGDNENACPDRPRTRNHCPGSEESREGTTPARPSGACSGRKDDVSLRRAEPADDAKNAEQRVYGSCAAREAKQVDVRSQPALPQQEAVNVPDVAVCNERAHVEITHFPGLEPPTPNRDLLAFVRELAGAAAEPGWFLQNYVEWSNRALLAEAARLGALLDATDEGEALHADIAAEYWKRTTADGKRFARMEARQARDLAGVERLAHILRSPPRGIGECVPSIRPAVQQALQL